MDVIDRELYTGGITPRPMCPRCGYHMGGKLAGYKETCPLGGTCSECGYQFEWVHVMRPDRRLPLWLFDYAEGSWGSWKSAWKTLWMSLIPWAFFQRVRLWHVPVPQRFFLWIPLLLIVGYVISAAFSCAALWLALNSTTTGRVVQLTGSVYVYKGPYEWTQYLNILAGPFGNVQTKWTYSGTTPPGYAITGWSWEWPQLITSHIFMVSASLAWPVALLLLRPTRRLAKVRWSHVLRCCVYSLGWIVLIAWALVGIKVFDAVASGLGNMNGGYPGEQIVRGLRYSWFADFIWGPVPLLEDFGASVSLVGAIFAMFVIVHQGVWWYLVIKKHWKLPRPGLTWSLLALMTAILAVLAILGPTSYRYIFMNM